MFPCPSVGAQVCGHTALLSLDEFRQNSTALLLHKRSPNMPMVPPASREDHNPSISHPSSSQTSPAVSPDTEGAFCCSECEAFNDHAHFSRRKGGVVCQVCGTLSRMMLEEFVFSSAELQRKILETACPQDPGGPQEEAAICFNKSREEEETEVGPPPVFVAKKSTPKVQPLYIPSLCVLSIYLL